MRRTIIVPPFEERGLCGAAFLVGFVLGVGARLASDPLFRGIVSGRSIAMVAAVFFLPAILFGAILPLLTNRPYVAFGAGAAVSIGSSCGERLVMGIGPSFAAPWWSLVAAMLPPLVLAFILGGLAMLTFRAVRSLVVDVFEGDATSCNSCGYRAGSPFITVCPECGIAIDPTRFRVGWLHRVGGKVRPHARALNTIAWIAVTGSLTVPLVSSLTSSSRLFMARLQQQGTISPGFIWQKGTWPGGTPTPGPGAVVPIAPGSTRSIHVVYLPRDLPNHPAMQLQVHDQLPNVLPFGQAYTMPVPRIMSDLDRAQAEWVVKNGLPQSLINAMVSAVVPARAAPTSTPPDIYVDPSPFIAPPN